MYIIIYIILNFKRDRKRGCPFFKLNLNPESTQPSTCGKDFIQNAPLFKVDKNVRARGKSIFYVWQLFFSRVGVK